VLSIIHDSPDETKRVLQISALVFASSSFWSSLPLVPNNLTYTHTHTHSTGLSKTSNLLEICANTIDKKRKRCLCPDARNTCSKIRKIWQNQAAFWGLGFWVLKEVHVLCHNFTDFDQNSTWGSVESRDSLV
jgi:hypothetical protein